MTDAVQHVLPRFLNSLLLLGAAALTAAACTDGEDGLAATSSKGGRAGMLGGQGGRQAAGSGADAGGDGGAEDPGRAGAQTSAGRGGKDAGKAGRAGGAGRGGRGGAGGADAGGDGGATDQGGAGQSGGHEVGGTAGLASTSGGAPPSGGSGGDSNSGGDAGGGGESASTSGGEGGDVGLGGMGSAGGGAGGSGGASCSNAPEVLAASAQAWALAVSDGDVYFTTHLAQGEVRRVPTSGGSTELLLADELFPHEIAVNNGQLFIATLGASPGHLIQASTSGTDREELTAGAPGDFAGIFSLSADAENVYFTSNLNVVTKVPLAGGPFVELSGGPFNSMVVDVVRFGSALFWTNHGVGTFVPRSAESASIISADVSGSPPAVPLVNRLDYPQFAIAVDAEGVVWNDETAIYRTALDGGLFTTLVTLLPAPADVSPVIDLLSDGTYLYFANRHALYRAPVAGGEPELMTDGWQRITRLEQDESSIYFTDPDAGSVVKLAKCASSSPSDGSGGSGSGGAGGGGAGGTAGSAGSPSVTPTPVATVAHPWGLAIDDSYLYYSVYETGGGVQRVPLAGGPPEPVLTAQTGVHDISVDGSHVYYCTADTSAGRLLRVPKGGGTGQVLATGTGNYGVGRATTDSAFAYFITGYSSLYRVKKDGGTPAAMAVGPYNSNAVDLTVDNGRVFWLNDGIWNSSFTAKLTGTGYVGEAPVSGSSDLGRDALVSGLSYPLYRVAVDASSVYAISGTTLYRVGRSGGDTVVLGSIAPASGTIVDMHLDSQHAYFADLKGAYRLPLAGGSTEVLASGLGSLRALALDADNVYLTDYGNGAVLKLPK